MIDYLPLVELGLVVVLCGLGAAGLQALRSRSGWGRVVPAGLATLALALLVTLFYVRWANIVSLQARRAVYARVQPMIQAALNEGQMLRAEIENDPAAHNLDLCRRKRVYERVAKILDAWEAETATMLERHLPGARAARDFTDVPSAPAVPPCPETYEVSRKMSDLLGNLSAIRVDLEHYASLSAEMEQ